LFNVIFHSTGEKPECRHTGSDKKINGLALFDGKALSFCRRQRMAAYFLLYGDVYIEEFILSG
jgi:hypothetical protein